MYLGIVSHIKKKNAFSYINSEESIEKWILGNIVRKKSFEENFETQILTKKSMNFMSHYFKVNSLKCQLSLFDLMYNIRETSRVYADKCCLVNDLLKIYFCLINLCFSSFVMKKWRPEVSACRISAESSMSQAPIQNPYRASPTCFGRTINSKTCDSELRQ